VKHSLSHYFIPQAKNNHRAALLRVNAILILIAFYLLNQSVIKFVAFLKPGVLGYSSEITAQKVLNQTNQQRQNNGLPVLKYNSVLSDSATRKAQDMFANNYWAHNSPAGKVPWDFFKESGYKYTVAGENLARDFYDTSSLLKAWMNSPTHRDNIVNSKYQEIGIGVVNGVLGGVKTTLVVQHFANPASAIASQPQKTSPQNYQQPIPEKVPAIQLANEVNTEEVLLPSSELVTSQAPEVLAGEKKYINPLLINKIVGTVLFLLIISVLFIDGFGTLKNNNRRLTGSTVGHIAFLVVILMLILTNTQGVIF
jgi:uncharacterized protein YkwD